VPDAVVDLRYATPDNFTHVQLYPSDARCLVHESMAAGLDTAAAQLRQQGFVLVFWDCYRPHAVQIHMFQVVPNPAWVARPGPYARSHEAGRSVDVTLGVASEAAPCAPAQRVAGHCLLDMGTDFDDFTPLAYAFATADGDDRGWPAGVLRRVVALRRPRRRRATSRPRRPGGLSGWTERLGSHRGHQVSPTVPVTGMSATWRRVLTGLTDITNAG
jgi:D-alanyl-D-alanine dipeptidase